MTHQDIINLLIAAACSLIAGGLVTWISIRGRKQSQKFYGHANKIEAMILTGESFDIVMAEMIVLKNESYCQYTGNRIRELAKMIHVKYGIQILQNP